MNSDFLKHEIEKKNNFIPYHLQNNFVKNIKTDMNIFPYNRYFRGKQNSDSPHFFDRQAGYSKICNQTSQSKLSNQNLILADCCFQMPCTTILPCSKNTYQPNVNQCVFYCP
jgi:hypothetical protein